jgi:hypothetical protein
MSLYNYFLSWNVFPPTKRDKTVKYFRRMHTEVGTGMTLLQFFNSLKYKNTPNQHGMLFQILLEYERNRASRSMINMPGCHHDLQTLAWGSSAAEDWKPVLKLSYLPNIVQYGFDLEW